MNGALASMEVAAEGAGSAFCSQFQVGGVSVQVFSDRFADINLGSRLESFQAESVAPDICVQIERVPHLAIAHDRQLFDSGAVWQLYEFARELQFDFSTPAMGEGPYKRLIVDREFRHARLLIGDGRFTGTPEAASPLDYPLDELLIMHRLTQERAIELHGTGIVRPGGEANLFVGHSGAGKSTTTRLWTEREDVEVLSDDRIIVRREEQAPVIETPLQAIGSASRHGVLRLRGRSASPTGRSAQDDKVAKQIPRSSHNDNGRRMRMYGTPWHGEAMYASPNSAPLARIFVLEHGLGNVITLLTPSQAVAELFARSFVPFHRHEYVESALMFLEEVADSVPVYRYAFEPDARAVEKIIHFHD